MAHRRQLLLSLAFLLACGARGGDGAPSGSAAAPVPAPGTLCEHGVSAELCPKCEPSLAAVYQGNGNWCPEHGMPESFCPICHPEAKGQPPSGGVAPPATQAKVPADGLKVRLQSEVAERGAGLAVTVVTRAEGASGARFPARVVYDATRSAEVTASAGGVLRSVSVDLGVRVKAGDTLAQLDSADVGAGRTRLYAAQARVKAAEERVARLASLEQDGIVAKKQRLEADLELQEARADATAEALKLKVYGADAGKGGSYSVTSPLDGVVTRSSATMGKLVEEREALFTIVDPSSLWLEVSVPEADLARVREGAEALFTVPSLEGETFAGVVKSLLPEVDRHTRAVIARVSVQNPHGKLRANMFGEAVVLGAPHEASVVVPKEAVQTVGQQRFVFVKKGALLFEVRHVEVASRDGARTVVSEGLSPGEEVVTTGSFLLKTETLKDSIGAGCCSAD